MKSTSRTVLASLIVTTFIISGPTARAATPQPVFTPAQEARIGEVAADYLVAHPEVLVNVSQKLQEQQQERQMQAMTAAVAEHQGALLDDKGTPSYGPADAQVTVVEFFDYQCI